MKGRKRIDSSLCLKWVAGLGAIQIQVIRTINKRSFGQVKGGSRR